jgi:hypothetical protein
MMGMLKQAWAPAVAAGVGTFTLSLVAWGFSAIVPCVGWLLPWTLACLGLGAILITRIGTQNYPGTETVTPTEEYRLVISPEEPASDYLAAVQGLGETGVPEDVGGLDVADEPGGGEPQS